MSKQENKTKREKGITLVALIITIVIIVILSSVTISATFGDNGIIKKAELARELASNSTIAEAEDMNSLMDEYSNIMKGDEGIPEPPKDTTPPTVNIAVGEVTENSIAITVNATDDSGTVASYKYYLNAEEKDILLTNTYTFTGLTTGTEYEIKVEVFDEAGNKGENSTKVSTSQKQGIDSGEISKNPNTYYGAEVKGYTCSSQGVSKWRIFYADNSNIYLIADDYISYLNAPKGKNGSSIVNTDREEYKVGFTRLINDYSETNWINSNSKGKKWLSKYLGLYSSSTNDNIKAVAYMMDTNIWNTFAGKDAEYAMGGPTLEMFCASYKQTHPNKYMEYEVNNIGYQIKWNTDQSYSYKIKGLPQDDYNKIYINSDRTKAFSMWMATPSGESSNNVMLAYMDGSVTYYGYDGYDGPAPGLRPIVCLKPEIKLEKKSNEIYEILKL